MYFFALKFSGRFLVLPGCFPGPPGARQVLHELFVWIFWMTLGASWEAMVLWDAFWVYPESFLPPRAAHQRPLLDL